MGHIFAGVPVAPSPSRQYFYELCVNTYTLNTPLQPIVKVMKLIAVLVIASVCAYAHAMRPTPTPPYVVECVDGHYPPSQNLSVHWYTVDLDLPASQRWNVVANAKKNEIRALIGQFKDFIRNLTNSNLIIYLVDNDLGPLVDTMPQPFQDEIRGVANVTGIPLGEIFLYNIFYEVFTVCTSIIAENEKGDMFHARNLDFGLFLGWDIENSSWIITSYLRPAIVNLNFVKGGKILFSATNFAGYIGILTGMKPGLFTLTMNERFNINGGYIGILEWILGKRSDWWMGFLTRHVLETATSFKEANATLSLTPMLAPAYFILGGNKSGEMTVITRSRAKAIDNWVSNSTDHPWYILETNYDHWKAPFFLDDRRTPANQCMQKKGQAAMGFDALFNVLSSRPVLNKLTTYTALMEVKTGRMETYLQFCPEPCMPW